MTAPTITTAFSNSIVNLYNPFTLTIKITIPTDFNNILKLDILGNTTDGTPRMKICLLNISYIGENLPCSNCMNLTSQYFYSANAITPAYDRISWQVANVKNNGLRTASENSTSSNIV